jgi:hypothetical protein
MRLNILNFGPESTAVAEASAKQAFVDILDNGIIKPLTTFMVNEKSLVWAHSSLIIDDPKGKNK